MLQVGFLSLCLSVAHYHAIYLVLCVKPSSVMLQDSCAQNQTRGELFIKHITNTYGHPLTDNITYKKICAAVCEHILNTVNVSERLQTLQHFKFDHDHLKYQDQDILN